MGKSKKTAKHSGNEGLELGIVRKRMAKMEKELEHTKAELEVTIESRKQIQYNLAQMILGRPFPGKDGVQLKVMPARMAIYEIFEEKGELYNVLPASVKPQVKTTKALVDMLLVTATRLLQKQRLDEEEKSNG